MGDTMQRLNETTIQNLIDNMILPFEEISKLDNKSKAKCSHSY